MKPIHMSAQLDRPLLDLHELRLPRAISVQELFLRHRSHHGAPVINTTEWQADLARWQHLRASEQEVFVHVLSRFVYGMEVAQKALPTLRKAAARGGRSLSEQYEAISQDTGFIVTACRDYRLEVAGKPGDTKALSENFLVLFDQIFPSRVQDLEFSFAGSRREQIRSEARLRVVYHIIGEGLGAITGIWGMNAAMRELGAPQEQPTPVLPGLARLIADMTLILRRHIAFGLSEFGELAREGYFSTVRAAIEEFKADRPVLQKMRDETFARWDPFPFDIDQRRLSQLGQSRVLGWLGSHVVLRPGGVPRKQLKELSGIV